MDRQMRSKRDGTSAARGAFTLIELLVVVSVIALLIGILVPGLGLARSQAQEVACAAMQRQLVTGVLGFTNDNQDQIPGVTTTGLPLLNTPQQDQVQWASQTSTRPVHPHDWVSPSVGDSLPAQRGPRLFAILRTYKCPTINLTVTAFGSGPGRTEVDAMITAGDDDLRPTSYLMPVQFMYSGDTGNVGVGSLGSQRILRMGYPNLYWGSGRLPRGFFPYIGRIGEPARKVALADGFRYFDERTGTADIDVSMDPASFGCFGSSGGVFNRERSYGASLDPQLKRNIKLSYRHQGEINAAFFDGHVQTISEPDSRNPTLWYPTKSTMGTRTSEIDPRSLQYVRAGATID